ncbi:Transcriptional activator of nitrogen related genes [Komagataella phaffii CBS 7435]|uniref:Transcriptional activator of genes regulated by nitrogen catabolite repression (NCR) n=2 Tax=Komagataella phaffii TaxID=460519 RepID=C4QVB3_KOMPG|nr:Transcriptional activator of genes regulated by nitrogen catabolite repression (NCR) [Komagataella phaffii GS115]AOA60977.1 GQ67_02380T0 [Komagataella phaffii]CAH2445841.1 Transcriptional activator of nitrogen related genes [Komagataella phaffii CBS 7435]AOA65879.1 GQ68_02867T0 [Komagataella phaffii GS115]CAY67186.1 Transcriptional activator of genes regulated by nitrogen catabolite repression (NCR) [Komagataella phaffii GS115]CCA36296.1 Transcriptional activator of nitrogen related genes [
MEGNRRNNTGSLKDLEDSPSIWGVYSSAKKLLDLYPRVENRTLRNESKKTQMTKQDSLSGKLHFSELQLDDSADLTEIISSAPGLYYSPDSLENNSGAPSSYSDSKVKSELRKPKPSMMVTPSSMNDSPLHDSNNLDLNSMWKFDSNDDGEEDGMGGDFSDIIQDKSLQEFLSDGASHKLQLAKPTSETTSITTTVTVQKDMSDSSSPKADNDESITRTQCSNCKTEKTPLWRRDGSGNTLCNACGLFQKLHGTVRPLSLKTDVIRKRNSKRQQHQSSLTHGLCKMQQQQQQVQFQPQQHEHIQPSHSTQTQKQIQQQQQQPYPYPYNNSLPTTAVSFSPYGGSQDSYYLMRGNSLNSNAQKHKNVPILPKPSRGPSNKNIPVPMMPQQQDSPYTSFSPHSAGFKRRKSQISLSGNNPGVSIPASPSSVSSFTSQQPVAVASYFTNAASPINSDLGIISPSNDYGHGFSNSISSSLHQEFQMKRGIPSSPILKNSFQQRFPETARRPSSLSLQTQHVVTGFDVKQEGFPEDKTCGPRRNSKDPGTAGPTPNNRNIAEDLDWLKFGI